MKKIVTFFVSMLLLCAMFCVYAQAYGVSLISKKSPSSVNTGKVATYKLSLKYDNTIYGIPVPSDGYIGIELASNCFEEPKYVNGSFKEMKCKVKMGDCTNVPVWQCYKHFVLVGEENKSYTINATAKSKNNEGKSYMGCGKKINIIAPYNYYFSVKVK